MSDGAAAVIGLQAEQRSPQAALLPQIISANRKTVKRIKLNIAGGLKLTTR